MSDYISYCNVFLNSGVRVGSQYSFPALKWISLCNIYHRNYRNLFLSRLAFIVRQLPRSKDQLMKVMHLSYIRDRAEALLA